MSFKICYVERREGGSPSIERVFRAVADQLKKDGIAFDFAKAPFGNSFLATVQNILFFRPPRADVYHITGHIHYMALVLPKDRTVLTVHDLTVLDFRNGLRRWLIDRLYFKWPVRRLLNLTVISQATKEALVRRAGIDGSRIRVIDNPLMTSRRRKNRDFNAEKPTILQVGTAPNKNLPRLITALQGLNCRLRIIGPLSRSLEKRLHQAGIEFASNDSLDDDAIEAAYQEADIVAVCSTNEGFGLPIIEAQAAETVVLTSDREPMRYVAGSGAVLVDPEDVDSIREGILEIQRNDELRTELIAKGIRNIERFEVRRIASEYLDLYRSIVTKKRSF